MNLNLRDTLIGFRIVKKGLTYVVNLRSMVDVKERNPLEIQKARALELL